MRVWLSKHNSIEFLPIVIAGIDEDEELIRSQQEDYEDDTVGPEDESGSGGWIGGSLRLGFVVGRYCNISIKILF